MQQRSVTRDMPQLSMRAQFDLSTLDVEKRTVDLVWTTGAPVLRGGFFTEPYFEELSLDPKHVRMGRLQSGAAPLLNSHRAGDISDILGVVLSATLGKTEGRAKVKFDSGAEGEDAMRRVGEGTLRNVSVGYQTFKMQEVKRGADAKIPTFMAVDWEPAELSLLPIGADAGAGTRSAVGMSPCVFLQERAMPDETIETTTTNPSPTQAAAPAPAPTAEQRAQIAREATERVLGIQRIGRALKRPDTDIAKAIAEGVTLADFRAQAQDAFAEEDTIHVDKRDHRIEAGADQRDKVMQRNENWLIVRSGMSELIESAAKKQGKKVDLDPGESRGLTLVEMARDCLERAGVKTRGMDVMQMIGKAFTHRGAGANSTSDFPILFENVQHKLLLAAYQTTPDTWRRWCVVGSVTDFRAHNRYRQGALGVFDDLTEGGEYKSAPIPDGEKQSITAGTKGRMIALTRQVIINDDMSALTDAPTRLGRAAALTIEVGAYAQLALNGGNGPTMGDTLPMFHANHGNIGTGAALSVASIDADRVLMASQKDPSGNELLELRPAVLLLPIGLGGQANVINKSQYDTDKVANARNQEPNKVVGLYRDIVDTARLTGTVRYSFCDPGINPVMEVAFLNGQQEPYLEMQNGWMVDGVQYKARLDVGFAGRDWRGVVRNAGV